MPHTTEDKQRAITRLRRIKGQAEALERAVEAGSDCAPILQQLAAMRGAVHGPHQVAKKSIKTGLSELINS